jgi:cyanate lyase
MSKAASERQAQSRRIIAAMNAKGLSFKSLSAEIGVSPFTTAAALNGQMSLPKDAAGRAAKVLGVAGTEEFLTEIPMRGSLDVPTDPTIYRFYEIVQSTERHSKRSLMRSSTTAL